MVYLASIRKSPGGGGLGSHLGKAYGNDEVRTLEGRGLNAEGIRD